ncbi:hypothetical protein EDD16DRAFT_1708617 [Pisolithus croceorrhizus]|nr:hypothetical protein EV401DRAFT_2077850 [Pisolithus croceorrhizus]KAI6115459.1 hypothetical protein EDD16DRAFT_1708617 [Pisolithus croceorrhizus]KAI6141545.1 hypothetical protein EDD17DRAFT_1769704 [Pisolithus thermaeus]
MTDEQLQPPALTGGNVDHPHQSTSIEVVDGLTQPSMITEGDISQGEEPDHSPTVDFGNQDCRQLQALFLNAVAGDAPTPDEHQALEQAGLAMSDADDDWWYANLCLDMKELEHLILCQEDQVQFQPEVQQIPLSTFWMIDEISLFIPNWMPRSPNKYAGFVFPWWVDGSLQYMVDFKQMRGARIFPIAHKYFQHTWPLQQLSMGDWIDEWMEEKVSAYMITVRGVWFALSRLLSLWDA